MSINIKNKETLETIDKIIAITHEGVTEAVKNSVELRFSTLSEKQKEMKRKIMAIRKKSLKIVKDNRIDTDCNTDFLYDKETGLPE